MKWLNPTEYPVAKLVTCGRHLRNRSIEELAHHVGIEPAELLEIEAGTKPVSVYLWRKFALALELPLDSAKQGFIDQQSVAELRSGEIENGFRLPTRYSSNKCFKILEFLPYFAFISDRFGVETLTRWLYKNGIPTAFLAGLDNQLNFEFYTDLVFFLDDELGINDVQAQLIARYAARAETHGSLSEWYLPCSTPLQRLQRYIEAGTHYQCMFRYQMIQVDEKLLKVAIEPDAQLFSSNAPNHDATALSFLDQMREALFLSVSSSSFEFNQSASPDLRLIETQSFYRFDERTVYEVYAS